MNIIQRILSCQKNGGCSDLGFRAEKGCGVTIKHFACNNQEDKPNRSRCLCFRRALREIYFRGFEIAVKESAPAALMSSYNRSTASMPPTAKDLCNILAREEWGFEGVIMSDWNTTVPKDGSIPWKCGEAGNDIIMPGNTEDDKNIREAYAKGDLPKKLSENVPAGF